MATDHKPITMGRLARRNIRAKPSRFVATMLAVLVGTGFLAGALVLRESLSASLQSNAVNEVRNVDAAVEPKQLDSQRGNGGQAPSGVPMNLLAPVQKSQGVAGAAGIATGQVEVMNAAGKPARAGSLGRLWIPVAQINPWSITAGTAPAATGQIAIDEDTADQLGLHPGSAVNLRTTSGAQQATVVGVTRFGDEAASNVSGDIFVSQDDAASYLQSGVQQYDAIYVSAVPGQTATALSSVAATVGANYDVLDNASLVANVAGQSQAIANVIGTGLQIFAYVALFVCVFIIYNTFSIIVAQRLREFALLRAIGADTRQIRKSVRREAILVGLVASAAGLLLGIVLFLVLIKVVPGFRDITGGGAVRLRVGLGTVVQVMLLGFVVTFVSALVPSFRAGRTPPIAALSEVSIDRSGSSRFRLVVGPALIAIGAAMLVLGVTAGIMIVGVFGPVFLFLGVLIGGPRLAVWFTAAAGFVVRPLARRVGTLAVENVRRNPNRTATTANALVIGVFLVVFVTAAGGAVRDYASDQLSQLAGPDLTVAVQQGSLPTGLPEQIQAIPGVTAVAPVYPVVGIEGADDAGGGGGFGGNGSGAPVAAVDFSQLGALGFQPSVGSSLNGLADNEVVMWNIIAQSRQLTVGSPVVVTMINGKTLNMTVGAIVQPVFTIPPTLMSSKAALAADPDLPPQQLGVQTEPGRQQEVQQQIEDLTVSYTTIVVYPGNIFGQLIKSIFTALIESVNALLGVAVVIALFGIVNTLILSVTERTREIGVLRAVGMTRTQLRSTVRIEALVVAMLGTSIGIAFGLFVAYFVTRPIFSDGKGAFTWPVQEVALVALLGVVLGIIASLVPAWRAGRLNILDSIRNE